MKRISLLRELSFEKYKGRREEKRTKNKKKLKNKIYWKTVLSFV